jgi:hypothetical protein
MQQTTRAPGHATGPWGPRCSPRAWQTCKNKLHKAIDQLTMMHKAIDHYQKITRSPSATVGG